MRYMSIRREDLRERVSKAVDMFNRYRSPEATVTLQSFSGTSCQMKFTGCFCHTCGFHDYFNDLIVFLEEEECIGQIVDIAEDREESIVTFAITPLQGK